MGNTESGYQGPQILVKDLCEFMEVIRNEDEYKSSPLRPVHEVLIHSFVHPKETTNPLSISSGVLTGGYPLWAFTVGEQHGQGDLYYYVYDTKVTDHRSDGTWVVEHTDLVLVKAQIGLEGYKPNLRDMLNSAIRVFGGYTKFTPSMIHRLCKSQVDGTNDS